MDLMIAAGSRQVTIRVDNSEIQRAKNQAAARGLKYQTYIKMLLHEALRKPAEAAPRTAQSNEGVTITGRGENRL